MRRLRTKRRAFTLQLFDRIEPQQFEPPSDPPPAPDSDMNPTVRDALQGHPLECPRCHCQPDVNGMTQDNHAHVVHSWNGPAGVATYPTTTTLEAHCYDCSLDLTYDIADTGLPRCTNINARYSR